MKLRTTFLQMISGTGYPIDSGSNPKPVEKTPESSQSQKKAQAKKQESKPIPQAATVSQLMSQLTKNGPIDFIHPRYPNRTFRLQIQRDVLTKGVFQAGNAEDGLMMYVELLPENANEKPHIIALLTGLKQTGPNDVDINWVSRFDYSRLEAQTRKIQTLPQMAKKPPMIDAIGMNMAFGTVDETHPQMKLLHSYLTQRVWADHEPTDQEVSNYFRDRDALTQFEGIGQAAVEYLSQSAPLNTNVSFDVAHIQTADSLSSGKDWNQTQLGRIALRNNTSLTSIRPRTAGSSINKVTVTKTSNGQPFFSWQ